MPLDLSMCRFTGPALPEPFVRFELDKELKDLLPKTTGEAGRELAASWDAYRRHLRELVSQGGPLRVRNAVIEPLARRLGYDRIEDGSSVTTREGQESGGDILVNGAGRLRVWTTALGEDLDAPFKRGHAYRFSHLRIAQRVLLATNERIGILTNGVELRILISDPARTDSQIEIPVESQWKRTRDVPDSYRLVQAVCSPTGLKALPDLIEKARLKQTGVTKELRKQARQAVELFVQDLLNRPDNAALLAERADKEKLAQQLWFEGVINIFRMLFILKMESVDDPARAFSFASTSLWRNTFSPSVGLAPVVRAVIDKGTQSGDFLENGLRSLYRMFTEGLACTEINVKPLGGALFGRDATPLISSLKWGELAVAHLLDCLLWTPKQRGAESRERVHYGSLTVQDLGRVYESLIELEPGITVEPMCRLRRRKLEVVVPVAQGERYRKTGTTQDGEETEEEEETEEAEEDTSRSKKTEIEWIEEIPASRFYLRVGLGRKTSGSHYTPDSFVKFLVRETLGPLCDQRSPRGNPQPLRLLDIKVADIAMGSGHFLFEACEFLGDKLYEACRLCDELAMQEEAKAEKSTSDDAKKLHLAKALEYRQRVLDLPDPNDELMAYLPSRAPEDGLTAYSVSKAQAICKRLVAVHCLYGVDLNPLAVDLAKLSLWIETHAEGLPLTFLDHRFVVGDSLSGPFFEQLLKFPGTRQPIEDLLSRGVQDRFTQALQAAMRDVRELEATVGVSLSEIEAKKAAKARMDQLLDPFKLVAAAWAGGVMLGAPDCDDQGYADLIKAVAEGAETKPLLDSNVRLQLMVARGRRSVSFDLAFPDVFFLGGDLKHRRGFDVVLGNPPWDAIQFKSKEFFANFDFSILDATTKREREAIEERLTADPACGPLFDRYKEDFEQQKRANEALYSHQKVFVEGDLCGRQLDLFRVFMERNAQLIGPAGQTGVVVPSAFHANEGATGIRRLYLNDLSLRCCYSFENRRKLFDIHRSFKFAIVVAARPGPTTEFPCAFYLHDDGWLFGERCGRELRFDREFVQRTGAEYLLLLELRTLVDVAVARAAFRNAGNLARHCQTMNMQLQRQPVAMDMANESWAFVPTGGLLPRNVDPREYSGRSLLLERQAFYLAEGKTFHQYDEIWEDLPRYCVPMEHLARNHIRFDSARYYRLAVRAVASSTNERTVIAAVLSPPVVVGHSVALERSPESTPRARVLALCAILNCHSFDWCIRTMTGANVTLFALMNGPVVSVNRIRGMLCHIALRLTCNHAGYAPLWIEQVGDEWREPKPKHTLPVLEGDDERWAVRAAIDAVVADAYGLTREQYAHVLSTFSHKSYPKVPELCLARFDELKSSGLDAFTKKHDPYWDIPLNESLPKPVIELPIPQESGDGGSLSGKKWRGRKRQTAIVCDGQADCGPLFSQTDKGNRE
jgi:hypothetical protein